MGLHFTFLFLHWLSLHYSYSYTGSQFYDFIPAWVDTLVLFLRRLSHQNLCPKTVDSYSHDRIKAYAVSRLLGGAKIGIYFGLCKLIPDFVVRTAVRRLVPACLPGVVQRSFSGLTLQS